MQPNLMETNPLLLEQFRDMLAYVPAITLTENMRGPVDVRDEQAIQATSRMFRFGMLTQEHVTEMFSRDFSGMKIAPYAVIEDIVAQTYFVRFAAYQ